MFNNALKTLSQQADKLTKEASVMATKYGKEAQKKMNAAMGKEQIVNIGSRQMRVLDQIAEGGYAYVYKAEDVETGQILALKRMLIQDEENIGLADMEIDIMKKMQGKPFVIQLLGHTKRKIDQPRATEYFVLMELCTGGNLMDLISRRHKEKLKEAQLATIFYQITIAVSHLHKLKPPIAHRDLKIENILIGTSGEMRLCDFGSCTSRAQAYLTRDEMTQEEERIQKYSTSMYRAPEMVDLYKKEVINEKVDIWALGCILYTLAFFTQPFQEGGNLQIIGGTYHIPEDHKFSKHVLALIKKTLTLSPKKRPDIVKLMDLNMKWIKALRKEGQIVDLPKVKKSKKAKDDDEDSDSDSDDESDDDEDEGEKKSNGKKKPKPTMNTDFGDDFATDFNAHSPTSGAKSSSSQLHPSQSFPNSFPGSHSTPPSATPSPAIPPVTRSASNPQPAGGMFDMSAFADSLVGGSNSLPPSPVQPAGPIARAVSPAHGVRTPSPSLPPPPTRRKPSGATTPQSGGAASGGFDFFTGGPAKAAAAAPVSPPTAKPAAAKAVNGAVKKAAAPAKKKKVEESSSEEESDSDDDSDEDDSEESESEEEDSDSDEGGKKKAKRPPLHKQK